MKIRRFCTIFVIGLALAHFERDAKGGLVNAGSGYTNDFSSPPLAGDWTTRAFGSTGTAGAGEIQTASALDAAVQTNTAAMITAPCGSATGTPPTAVATAVWSSAGAYLQTRPSQNAATLLMLTLTNNTGADVMTAHLGYDYTTNRAASAAEEVRGLRVYYSLSGNANSWSNLNTFSQTAQATLSADIALWQPWTNGGKLYLLWADDNGSGSPDDANNIDNLFVSAGDGSASCVLTSPTPGQSFGVISGTFSLPLSASTTPGPGATRAGVGFYDVGQGVLGSALNAPYSTSVNLPPGGYNIYAISTNSLGVIVFSVTNSITITNIPLSVSLGSPTNTQTFSIPTNVFFSATAFPGPSGSITGIGFFDTNRGLLISALTTPYTNTTYLDGGSYAIYAMVTNSSGATAFSTTNSVVVNVPPVDNTPPTILRQNPAGGATISNLTTIQVTFTEIVLGVDASDLLVNGVPATSVSGSGSNYTFTAAQPAYGAVSIRFAEGHGITDAGWPNHLIFYENNPEASWTYNLVDLTRPTIRTRTPASGSTVTNATKVDISFSEPVTGVDAADLLVNGAPAYALTGANSNYTFYISQPAAETVTVSWASNHGITDTAPNRNAFDGAASGWTFTLDAKNVLIASNSVWRFLKGTVEASSPTNAWRQLDYDDSGWSNAFAPFFFGDPYSNGLANFTLLSDMQGNYSSIYLRKAFTLSSVNTNLYLRIQIDDGFIAWINGIEVARTNVAAGELGHGAFASAAAVEPALNGAPYQTFALLNAANYLQAGPNVLAIHAFNQSGSGDFGFNAQLYTPQAPSEAEAPHLIGRSPAPGYVVGLSNITVTFSEPVTNLDAGDLLLNDVPATGVSSSNNTVFTFSFAQPAFGTVNVAWAPGHGIVDMDTTPKAFDGTLATWQYALLNPDSPLVFSQTPAAGATINQLLQLQIIFNKRVTGVDPADLLLNGAAATGVTGSGSNYVFTFAQPLYGTVSVSWSASHGIRDESQPSNGFESVAPGNTWIYNLVDQTAPLIISQSPARGAFVPSLSQITVNFSELMSGVNAGDLLINGKPASGVTGGGSSYTFSFAQPNASSVAVSWSINHGIADQATVPNPFDAGAPGATWTYTTIDSVSPTVFITPAPSLTVRSVRHIRVMFDEPVAGVDVGDLRVNDVPAQQVTGSGAGPYTFDFIEPNAGTIQVAWVANHGIRDLAVSPNAFAGGSWTYVMDPNLQTDFAVGYVVQISLDGLGATYLQRYLASAPDQFPNFVRLTAEAAYTMNARCDYDASVTIPNHASMFTGRPVLQPNGYANTWHHGYTSDVPGNNDTLHNSGNLAVPYKASMFDVAHDYGRTTAFYAGKARLAICDRSYDASNGGVDTVATDNGRDKIDFSSVADISGTSISNEINTVVADLSSGTPKQYTFIHIAEPDLTGHASSWGSVNWSNAVRNVDAQIGRILNAIDTNPAMANQTALIVTADHGGGGVTPNNHTEAYHITNYTIPFFLRAPGISGGVNLYGMFANRADPGTNRIDYTSSVQPIRNGDGSNLALSLLGLPPIPGSLMVPAFKVPAESLKIARNGGLTTVFWYDPSDLYVLEVADTLSSPIQWQTVTEGITLNETTKVFTISGAGQNRFYRLHRQ